MFTEKRPRGRPRGSEKNDFPLLAQVADLLVRDPSLRPTTAMKRILQSQSAKDWGASLETLLRRLQVKWKKHCVGLIEAARERAQPTPTALAFDRQALRVAQEFEEATMAVRNSPFQKAMGAAQELRFEKALSAVRELPLEKALMAMVLNSPLVKSYVTVNLLFATKIGESEPKQAHDIAAQEWASQTLGDAYANGWHTNSQV